MEGGLAPVPVRKGYRAGRLQRARSKGLPQPRCARGNRQEQAGAQEATDRCRRQVRIAHFDSLGTAVTLTQPARLIAARPQARPATGATHACNRAGSVAQSGRGATALRWSSTLFSGNAARRNPLPSKPCRHVVAADTGLSGRGRGARRSALFRNDTAVDCLHGCPRTLRTQGHQPSAALRTCPATADSPGPALADATATCCCKPCSRRGVAAISAKHSRLRRAHAYQR